MDRILLLGGSGLLGTQIQRLIDCDAPSHEELDIMQTKYSDKKYDLVIHAAAYTNVDKAEVEPEKVFDVNLGGTLNLLYEYGITPFVYISSEYAHNPVNMYSASKYAGELAVKCLAEKYLIIRTLFKAVPFPYEQAFIDQWTFGDEVTIIAPLIVDEIKRWYQQRESQTVHIGTGRKRIFDIAVKSRPDVIPNSIKDIKTVKLPVDYL